MGGCLVPQDLTKRQQEQEKAIRELLQFREAVLRQKIEQDRSFERTAQENQQKIKANEERIAKLEEELRRLRPHKREKSPVVAEPSIESRIEKILSNDTDIRKTYERVKNKLGRS